MQAKLTAIDDDDINSNGLGVVETTIVLYDVSSQVQEKASGKKSNAREPRTRHYAKFYLN